MDCRPSVRVKARVNPVAFRMKTSGNVCRSTKAVAEREFLGENTQGCTSSAETW